jgi:hypothetical protein
MSDDEAPRPWRWRNCRAIRLSISFSPLPWTWGLGVWNTCNGGEHCGGCYGKHWGVVIGPLCFSAEADHGNISTGDWRARFGLSEEEAWERSK